MTGNNNSGNDRRGLASAKPQTRKRVAKAGGEAYHEKRGQHGTDNNSGSTS